MLEFEKTLAGKYKMYVDPAFANGEPITEESLKVGYKGSTEYKIPPGRIEFGSCRLESSAMCSVRRNHEPG